jgi:hypothetical protein
MEKLPIKTTALKTAYTNSTDKSVSVREKKDEQKLLDMSPSTCTYCLDFLYFDTGE